MAATRQQGSHLATALTGFTVFPAGLMVRATHPGIGVAIAIAGAGVLLCAGLGFYRMKRLEGTK